MSKIQRFLNAGSRGFRQGVGNVQALQQLFIQKEQFKRQKEQEEFNKTKARMERFFSLASAENPALQRIGWEGLTALSAQDANLFGGKRDFVAMFEANQGNDQLEAWRKRVFDLQKQYANKEIDAQAYGSALKIEQAELDLFPAEKVKDEIATIKRETEENNARTQFINENVTDRKIQRIQQPGASKQGIYGRGEYEHVPKTPDNPKPPTVAQIKGLAMSKWMNNTKLSPQEQIIVDKEIRASGKSPDQIKKEAAAKMDAWVENFKKYVKRPPRPAEVRQHMVNDMWGFLGPMEGEGENPHPGWKIAEDDSGKRLYQNPKTQEWVK